MSSANDPESTQTETVRPLKRRRVEEDQEACTNLGLTRDTIFWFTDGNVILSAGTIAFRVYYGTLATQSPVFDDMFGFPQPPSSLASTDAPSSRFPTRRTILGIFSPFFFPSLVCEYDVNSLRY